MGMCIQREQSALNDALYTERKHPDHMMVGARCAAQPVICAVKEGFKLFVQHGGMGCISLCPHNIPLFYVPQFPARTFV